ncbi:MAG: hypothetical protein WB785_10920 [Mycobacterium sp.]|uniref:hypothetical protein n=1 Tax=Mycobacterium sp. TaxID=1785 RepID=UPI003C3A455D
MIGFRRAVLALAIPLNLMLIVWMAIGRSLFGIMTAWMAYLMVLWAAPGAAGIADVVDGSDVLSAAASRAVEHRAGMASGGVLALHVRRRDRDSGRGRHRQRRGHSAQPLRQQLDDGVGISMLIAGFVGAAAWLVLMVLLPVGLTIRRPPPPAPGWAFHPYPPAMPYRPPGAP